ncbi:MAG TPA: sterol desaturase, partial [Emticicia sp.]
WQHFHFLVEIAFAAKAEKGLRNKLKVVFGRPSDFNSEMRIKAEKKFLSIRKVQARTTKFRFYVIAQITFTLVTLFLLLLFEHYIPLFLQTIIAMFILITLINCGAILEQRRWVFYLEFARASLVTIATFYYFPSPTLIGMSILLLIVSLAYFSSLQKQYLRLIYGKRKVI